MNDDLISRQRAINIVGWNLSTSATIEALMDLPVLNPERGKREGDMLPRNFCPSCGADMRRRSNE